MLATSRLWRKTVTRMAAGTSDLAMDHMYVDNASMQIILRPEQFDVLLTSNLFGDILSDEAAALAGSIGMIPSWSAGDGPPLVEPIHGTAPQLVGKDMANPSGAILCVSLLLRERFDLPEAADDDRARGGRGAGGGHPHFGHRRGGNANRERLAIRGGSASGDARGLPAARGGADANGVNRPAPRRVSSRPYGAFL